MAKRPVIIKITGPGGQRREIPRGTIVSCSFDDEQDGGWTGGSLDTSVDITGLPTVATGDTLTVYYRVAGNLELRYFGSITRRAFSQEDGISLTLTTEGESSSVGRIMLNREVIIPGPPGSPPDISLLWREFALEAQLKRPDLFINADTIGIFKGQFDALYSKFGDTTRSIVQACGTKAAWSVRRLPLSPHTPILSFDRVAQPTDPISTARTIALPARSASHSEGEDDATDIRNIVYIKGGVPVNPNVVPNADFRLIEYSGDTFRNLIQNASFDEESGGGLNHWTLGSGASKKTADHSEGPTHSGKLMVELDHTGEYVEQGSFVGANAYIVPGHTFRLQTWARLEVGSGAGVLRFTFTWRDGGGGTISTVTKDFSLTDAIWNIYYVDMLCPATAESFIIRFTAQTPSVMVDDCNLYDASLILPRFHETRRFGSATVLTANYVQSAVRHPFRSSYAPEIAIKDSSDTSGQDAHFGTRNALDGGETVMFDISANASYRIMVDLISPKTPNGNYYKNGKFFIEVEWHKPDGSYISTSQYTIAAGSGFSDWNQFAFTATAPSNAGKAEMWITFRGSATYSGGDLTALGLDSSENSISRIIVGGFCMRAAGSQPQEVASKYVGLPALPGVQYEWIADGGYQTVIKCTDVMSIGSPEYLSIEQYGEHPDYVESDDITTQDEATFYAQAEFFGYAVGKPNGTVTLNGDVRQFQASEGLRLRGSRGRSLSSAVVAIKKASYKYDGQYETNLTWGIDHNDPYALFQSFLLKENKAGGQGAGNGYYSGATAGGGMTGGGSFSPMYWGTGPYSETDATLHDAYRPVNGVHILTSERTDWQGTTDEVDAAHVSSHYATTFSDIGARFDQIETDLSTAGLPGGGATIEYTFSTTTTNADPGNGILRLNNATQNTSTAIFADLLDNLGSDFTALLDNFDASSSANKGFIRLVKKSDATKWLVFNVTARISHTGYREFTLTIVASSGANPFANADDIVLFFTETGSAGTNGTIGANAFTTTSANFTQPNIGSTVNVTVVTTAWMAPGQIVFVQNGGYYSVSSISSGTVAVLQNLGYAVNVAPTIVVNSGATVTPGGLKGLDGAIGQAGAGVTISYNFDSGTANSDPGSGNLRLNNATQNLSTRIFADLSDSHGVDFTPVLDIIDDSTSPNKGYIRLIHATDATKWIVLAVSAVTTHVGYREIVCSVVASSTGSPFTALDPIYLFFTPNGDQGSTGAAGSVSRLDVVITTGTLANNATELGTFGLSGKKTTLIRVQANQDCRFRAYGNSTQRSSDASRAATTRYPRGQGVYTDNLLQTAYSTRDIWLSPPNLLVNADVTPGTVGYYSITNLSGGSTTITVTVTLEAGEEI